ncbi:MAG: DEAD/DEAH box helicase [Myxococcota bacterium]
MERSPAVAPVEPLGARVPEGGTHEPDEVLERFLGWVSDTGLTPYPEQEEAILELLADRHVVLSTPTGSGKSLVAQALHFRARCAGARSFYTAPVKALVSEKFFALCDDFGAEHVGMLTGDASVNRDAPILCATMEVLANMALQEGAALDAPFVVLDEFHYYGDRERGAAWQIPLITLKDTRFLLMSATLGNTAPIEERLAAFTGRPVAHVHSDERPVPLDYEYRETPLSETLAGLVEDGLAPVYVVSFTQRECHDLAQGSTGAGLVSKEDRARIAEALRGARFDTTYGRDLKRILGHGIGVHHAGLLPRYRLLVEQLAQAGLLKVIFGTDTLGVGVNVPIRTVVFTRLSKFDGEKVGILSVRDFKQIAGRAGRKGFDDRGAVVCQAPEHTIANKRAAASGRKRVTKKKPPRGFVPWNRDTFERLVERPPEPLRSRFDVSHGMIVAVLKSRRAAEGRLSAYAEVAALIDRSHETAAGKRRLKRRAAELFRSLRRAGVVDVVESGFGPPEVEVRRDLQTDFSLHGTLSLYLVEAVAGLDREAPTYAVELLSLVEAIQEDPRPILSEQAWKLRRELMDRLKAEGVDYEERRAKAEEVTHPMPEAAYIEESFRLFSAGHPWVREEDVRPKSVAREMFERLAGFRDYVDLYGLARSEGLLLRYLSQVHNTLARSVPETARTEEVYDVLAYLRTTLRTVDSSLVEAWESRFAPAGEEADAAPAAPVFDLATNEPALRARVRQEMLSLVMAAARGDWDEAAGQALDADGEPLRPADLEQALAPFLEEYERIVVTPEARRAHHTRMVRREPRLFEVSQTLLDPAGDHLWAVHGEVDLRAERDPQGPLVRVRRIGT